MLTAVQKEILQSLINLYRQSKGTSVKCESIAEIMNRNSGTIRNQMQALRSLGLVQGVPGPRGGYKPTINAYQTLDITDDPAETNVPIYINKKIISDISVNKIEFTSILKPGACEATISVLGDIKQLDLGDEIKIGPTPVNNLIIAGTIIGRDDVDNVLLIKTKTILSIPNIQAKQIATPAVKTIDHTMNVTQICRVFMQNNIKNAPVLKNNQIIGVIRASDIIKIVADNKTESSAENFMNHQIITSKDDISLTEAMDLLQKNRAPLIVLVDNNNSISGVLTFTDILKTLVTFIKE